MQFLLIDKIGITMDTIKENEWSISIDLRYRSIDQQVDPDQGCNLN